MASTTEYEDERVNLSKDAPKQARPRKKILVPPKPHEKRYSSFNKPQITLDTETTGLDPDKGDRILEIGCVRLNGREISLDPDDYLQIYINPERDIPGGDDGHSRHHEREGEGLSRLCGHRGRVPRLRLRHGVAYSQREVRRGLHQHGARASRQGQARGLRRADHGHA